MNIRLVTLLIALCALPTLAQAADKAATAAVTQRANILKAQEKGAPLASNGQQYQVLLGVRAAQIQSRERSQQTLARVGGGKLIETKGTFVVFTAAQQGGASLMQANGVTTYPTAINSRTGGVGIVSGTVSVKLRNMANAAAVGADHGVELVREFAHLQAVFYRVKSGQDVLAAAASLKGDSRVTSAEVEVIEHMNVPH